MTRPKEMLRLPSRTPAYVSREVGAAELGVSPETWDRWVDDGRLPPRAPGFPDSAPRWRWADVDDRLSGRRDVAEASEGGAISAGRALPDVSQAAEAFRNATTKGRKRGLAA